MTSLFASPAEQLVLTMWVNNPRQFSEISKYKLFETFGFGVKITRKTTSINSEVQKNNRIDERQSEL